MDFDRDVYERMADLLQRNLAVLYEAKKSVEDEWKEIESQRKDAEQRQEAVEEDRRRIVEQIDECKDLLRSINSML